MPKGYEWGVQLAEKKNKRGKAMGGMVMGIKKELVEKGKKIETVGEGRIVGWIRRENKVGG